MTRTCRDPSPAFLLSLWVGRLPGHALDLFGSGSSGFGTEKPRCFQDNSGSKSTVMRGQVNGASTLGAGNVSG